MTFYPDLQFPTVKFRIFINGKEFFDKNRNISLFEMDFSGMIYILCIFLIKKGRFNQISSFITGPLLIINQPNSNIIFHFFAKNDFS